MSSSVLLPDADKCVYRSFLGVLPVYAPPIRLLYWFLRMVLSPIDAVETLLFVDQAVWSLEFILLDSSVVFSLGDELITVHRAGEFETRVGSARGR